jgi:SAM-dependent methyltransferase
MPTKNCQLCGSTNLYKIIDLGFHPLADSFLEKKHTEAPITLYPLNVVMCKSCGHTMLGFMVKPEERYQKIDYSYTAGNSRVSVAHFKEMAEEIVKVVGVNKNDLVVDIGSNDGTLLKSFKDVSGAKVIGVEPSKNIWKIAQKNSIPTINDFFNKKTVLKISKKQKAKVITATNVFNHINDMRTFVNDIKNLLDRSGVFVFEVPYFLGLVENGEFDTIYLEHTLYFSVKPFHNFFQKNGLEIFKLERNDYMCSSIRVYVRKGKKQNKVMKEFIKNENDFGLYEEKTYKKFMDRIKSFKFNLNRELYNAKNKNDGKIIAIGAATKGNTLLNYCLIDNNVVDFVTDGSNLKIGKYMPGSNIPILPDAAIDDSVKYALILPWNIASFLMSKFVGKKIKFIVPKFK